MNFNLNFFKNLLTYNKTTKKVNNLYKLLISTDLLKGAYILLEPKFKKINSIKTRNAQISHIQSLLEKKSFTFTNFSKENKKIFNKDLNPIYLYDKLVQNGVSILLHAVYNKQQPYCDFNLSLNSSRQVLLNKISHWGDVKWFIKGDISDSFISFNQAILYRILKNSIEDKSFIDLCFNFIKANNNSYDSKIDFVLETQKIYTLTFILRDIYLSRLDLYIKNYLKFSILINYKKNLVQKLKNAKFKFLQSNLLNSIDTFICSVEGVTVIKYFYVRVLNTYLIGIKDSYLFCKKLQKNILNFSYRTKFSAFNERKISISNIAKKIRFLDVLLVKKATLPVSKNKFFSVLRKKRRVFSNTVSFFEIKVSLKDLLLKLKQRGLLLRKRNSIGIITLVGKPILGWVNLPMIILYKKYKVLINKLLQYYWFVANKSCLRVLYWIFRSSLAKTLAVKFKLKSMRQVFKKFGKTLNYCDNNHKISFEKPRWKNLR
jgi:hypothetical protein